jgi:hypothetical protein
VVEARSIMSFELNPSKRSAEPRRRGLKETHQRKQSRASSTGLHGDIALGPVYETAEQGTESKR